MNEGNRVELLRDFKGGWGSPTVKAGSKGIVVKTPGMFGSTYTVTFTDQGWSGKSVTVDGVKQQDLKRVY